MSRPEILFPLFTAVTELDGIGPKTAKSLERIGITRIKDLLFHLPTQVVERKPVEGSLAPYLGEFVIVEALIGGHRPGRTSSAPYRVRVFTSQDQPIDLTFFRGNGRYLGELLPMGEVRFVSGKLEAYGDSFQITHPDYIAKTPSEIPLQEPQYGLTEGISQKVMRKSVASALKLPLDFPEWLRDDLIRKFQFPGFQKAISDIHNPERSGQVDIQSQARLRLAYDEILSHQLTLAMVRSRRKTLRGKAIHIDKALIERAKSILPYELTGAQARAVEDILADFSLEKRMFRMLQGDVGAGKTAVAFLAMAAQASSGYQCVLLAPTEILARQHFASLQANFEALGLETVLLLGSDKSASRRENLEKISTAQARIIIGTHAVFQDAVSFANLGLAVIDEQHRFGVRERMRLVEKGGAVDLLSMSATPIPRSLAMSVHGEMDLSILDEKPQGRKAIETTILSQSKLSSLITRLKSASDMGRQIYWVCPLVSESEYLDLTAAEDRHRALCQTFGDDKVGLVHGRMDAAQKDHVMARFRDGELSILVATTVIEVGVDVPNASIMVIEGAERFGLSQLHQLRGRVGRGSLESFCVLLYGELGETARQRLELMRETDDGFVLAEADLRMRGAGDFIGTAQSGLPRFKFADLERHQDLVAIARDDARLIMDNDSQLSSARGLALRVLLYLMERDSSMSYLTKS